MHKRLEKKRLATQPFDVGLDVVWTTKRVEGAPGVVVLAVGGVQLGRRQLEGPFGLAGRLLVILAVQKEPLLDRNNLFTTT